LLPELATSTNTASEGRHEHERDDRSHPRRFSMALVSVRLSRSQPSWTASFQGGEDDRGHQCAGTVTDSEVRGGRASVVG
jgi:hypothetical protein